MTQVIDGIQSPSRLAGPSASFSPPPSSQFFFEQGTSATSRHWPRSQSLLREYFKNVDLRLPQEARTYVDLKADVDLLPHASVAGVHQRPAISTPRRLLTGIYASPVLSMPP